MSHEPKQCQPTQLQKLVQKGRWKPKVIPWMPPSKEVELNYRGHNATSSCVVKGVVKNVPKPKWANLIISTMFFFLVFNIYIDCLRFMGQIWILFYFYFFQKFMWIECVYVIMWPSTCIYHISLFKKLRTHVWMSSLFSYSKWKMWKGGWGCKLR